MYSCTHVQYDIVYTLSSTNRQYIECGEHCNSEMGEVVHTNLLMVLRSRHSLFQLIVFLSQSYCLRTQNLILCSNTLKEEKQSEVCVCVCVCVCTRVCMGTRACVCLHGCTYICICVHVYKYKYTLSTLFWTLRDVSTDKYILYLTQTYYN